MLQLMGVRLPGSDGTPIRYYTRSMTICHNIDTVYCCLVIVKDRTKPVAVADRGIAVESRN